MVLKIISAAYQTFFPTNYTTHIVAGVTATIVLRTLSQGRKTGRDRDLHARTILVTGGFTPVGLTLLQNLAERGAHIIALTPDPIDSPSVTIIISLLRTTFNNEQIYAEQCDLSSPSSIRKFCTKFLTGQETRIDGIVFGHEYQHVGRIGFLGGRRRREGEGEEREGKSLATFLITTLLLPALLVAPTERDIRIVTVVNPFYAAAANPAFDYSFSTSTSPASVTSSISATSPTSTTKPKPKPLFVEEGTRALRTTIFTRHLQRIMDALPSAQVPKTDDASHTIPVVSKKAQRSNIVAVSVSPGISRQDTINPLFNADWTSPRGFSWVGVVIYILLQPLLRILTKGPNAAIQTILHALFLPTPFKLLSIPQPQPQPNSSTTPSSENTSSSAPSDPLEDRETRKQEVLKPGALYAECAVVNSLKIPTPADPLLSSSSSSSKKGKSKAKKAQGEETATLPDDGEFGGEVMGRLVWEAYEVALKDWEGRNPNPVLEEVSETEGKEKEEVGREGGVGEVEGLKDEKSPY